MRSNDFIFAATCLCVCFALLRQVLDPPSCPEGTAEAEGLEDLSPDEKRVLERKLKKIRKKEEKKRLKAEGVTLEQTKPSGPSAQQQALDYLTW